ncbi:hypothetical protein SY89_00700 [Halolamina pelagica]|uniref:Uncharacterized protein n=1 Tax=Halolamina pelagica TaxID=699431 RepID=A0A0P7G9I0_9EURY|nr:hypothetical protein [Halolamina pelagica]KPN29980.1 hypothetical protein SY89_00700 [Halolamina pelagica]
MTVDLHPDTVEEARDRDGSAAEDRPEAISEALEGAELGYGDGEPLVGDTYDGYPNREELSNPSQGGSSATFSPTRKLTGWIRP